jgi:putative flippase GtrA
MAMKGFSATSVIGVADALIHWQIFFVLRTAVGLDQAASNFAAFCVAAAFSFYVNALYTFERETSVFVYLMFIGLMGAVSFGVGVIADARDLPGLATVASFSLLNLVLGYCFFRFVLFRERQT